MAATPETRLLDAMAQVVGAAAPNITCLQGAAAPGRVEPDEVYLIVQSATAGRDLDVIGQETGRATMGSDIWTLTVGLLVPSHRDPCKPPRQRRRRGNTGSWPEAAAPLENDPWSKGRGTWSMLWDIEYALYDRWERSPAFVTPDTATPEERTEDERIREFLSLSLIHI